MSEGIIIKANNYDLLLTNAGGCTVVSNKLELDPETRDYKKIAYIYENGEVKIFDENLPAPERKRIGA